MIRLKVIIIRRLIQPLLREQQNILYQQQYRFLLLRERCILVIHRKILLLLYLLQQILISLTIIRIIHYTLHQLRGRLLILILPRTTLPGQQIIPKIQLLLGISLLHTVHQLHRTPITILHPDATYIM